MKKSLLLVLLTAGLYTVSNAQNANQVTISGQINTDKDSVELLVWFSKDPVLGHGDENTRVQAQVDKNGRFSFTTAPVNSLARLFKRKGARVMEAWHGISAFPTLLLVDKQGKIYSSALPVIHGDPKNKNLEKNIDKLAKLIADALAGSGTEK